MEAKVDVGIWLGVDGISTCPSPSVCVLGLGHLGNLWSIDAKINVAMRPLPTKSGPADWVS